MDSDTQNSRRVLISGAGIAGLTAAYWFDKTGWDVVVVEKASALREGEFVIDFSGTGWDVADKMGLVSELRSRQTSISELSFNDALGNQRASVQMTDFAEMMGVGDKHVSINRRDLQNLLFESVGTNVEVRFSTSITAIDEIDDGLNVSFGKGTSDTFDLVIGADGLHSYVRSLVFGEESAFAEELGYQVSAFRVAGTTQGSPGVMNVLRMPNKQAGILDLGEGNILGLYVYECDDQKYVPRPQRRQVLIDEFSEMGAAAVSPLRAIDDQTEVYMDSTTQIVMPKWHKGKVVLIGDAAHSLTLVSGQGASMAMGGAFFLAEELKNSTATNTEEALARYDARMRPFIEELQVKSRKFAAQFIPSSRIGVWLTDKMVKLARVGPVRRYLAKQFSIQSLFEREAQQ